MSNHFRVKHERSNQIFSSLIRPRSSFSHRVNIDGMNISCMSKFYCTAFFRAKNNLGRHGLTPTLQEVSRSPNERPAGVSRMSSSFSVHIFDLLTASTSQSASVLNVHFQYGHTDYPLGHKAMGGGNCCRLCCPWGFGFFYPCVAGAKVAYSRPFCMTCLAGKVYCR